MRPGGVAIVNVLVEGTTYLGMFDPSGHCLFSRDEMHKRFAGWQILAQRVPGFPGRQRHHEVLCHGDRTQAIARAWPRLAESDCIAMKTPQADQLLGSLKSRFEKHAHRHPGMAWAEVQPRLAAALPR